MKTNKKKNILAAALVCALAAEVRAIKVG